MLRLNKQHSIFNTKIVTNQHQASIAMEKAVIKKITPIAVMDIHGGSYAINKQTKQPNVLVVDQYDECKTH